MLYWRCFLLILSHGSLHSHRFSSTYWNSYWLQNYTKPQNILRYTFMRFYLLFCYFLCLCVWYVNVWESECHSALVEVRGSLAVCPPSSVVSRVRLGSSGLHGKCSYPLSHPSFLLCGCWFPVFIFFAERTMFQLPRHLSSYETKLMHPKLFSHVAYYISLSETYFWKFIFPFESNTYLLF